MPVGLGSSVPGALVDSVNYDGAGRMTALRFPGGGNLWRSQSCSPWPEPRNGGMLENLKAGLTGGGISCSFASDGPTPSCCGWKQGRRCR